MAEHETRSIRNPQSLVAGLALLALAVFAVWMIGDLPRGTLRSMGPALLPLWLAYAVGVCGLALTIIGFVKDGDPLEFWNLRGPGLVIVGILAFALTIRPVPIGDFSSPGLGLLFAGPISIMIGGYATPEVRGRDLLILAFALTAFSMLLFGDLLNLPIPLFPQSFADLFPPSWSQKVLLRVSAGILVALSVVSYLYDRSRGSSRVDVAQHSLTT